MNADRHPRVVVLSSLFPSPDQPSAGVFIRERMRWVAKLVPVTVVSPQPWFPLQGLIRLRRPHFRVPAPYEDIQAGLRVLRPRFLSFPGIFKSLDGFFMALGAWRCMRRLQRSGEVDLIDAHFGYPDGYAATMLGQWLKVPVTVTLRGTESRHARDPSLRVPLAAGLHRASRIFAVSNSLRTVAMHLGIPGAKIQVVGNGVDAERFQPVPRHEARVQLGIPDDAPVLVSVGGLVERKGFHRVIECLPTLLKDFPNLIYLVVGGPGPEGDFEPQLREQVAGLGIDRHVRFLGALPSEQLKVPLSAADVFVLATSNEGWANVFLEAMACGLPVVTTNVGGNAEVVSAPFLGRVVPFGDSSALQQAIRTSLRHPWDRKAIRDHALQHAWAERAERIVQTFQGILSPSQGRSNPVLLQDPPARAGS